MITPSYKAAEPEKGGAAQAREARSALTPWGETMSRGYDACLQYPDSDRGHDDTN